MQSTPRHFCHQPTFFQKFSNHAGQVLRIHILIPKRLLSELLYRINNSSEAIHWGITEIVSISDTSISLDSKNFSSTKSKIAWPVFKLRHSKVSSNSSTFANHNSAEFFRRTFTNWSLEHSLSGGFKYNLIAIDIFSKYLDANSEAQKLVSIFHQHCYVPDIILSTLGSVFTSKFFKKLTVHLQIQFNRATLKHAQTIGHLERSHAVLKKNMKRNLNSPGVNWHNHKDLACIEQNTSFNSESSCTPYLPFHGRQTMLTLKEGSKLWKWSRRRHKAQLTKNFKTKCCSTINFKKEH